MGKRRIYLVISLLVILGIFWYVQRPKDRGRQSVRTFVYVPRLRQEIATFDVHDRHALAAYAQGRISELHQPTDFKELSRRIRLYKAVRPVSQDRTDSELGRWLEQQLFGSLLARFGTLEGLKTSFRGGGQGIVMTTGDLYFPFAVHAVRSLRLLNCTLPIEIWYLGRKDLAPTNIRYLSSFHQVRVRNLFDFFNTSLELWDGKPLAVLASTFDQVILMDADTVFLRDPSFLFDDHGYCRDGALFFQDRSLFPGQWAKSHWILDLFPEPHSKRVQNLRMLQGKSQYELESGVVVLDKRRHLVGLLTTCLLNFPGPMKTIIREETHGEKETFWIGLEMANEPYTFMPHPPGSIGVVEWNEAEKVKELCGKLAHFDRDGKLLWFNDAIAMGKMRDDDGIKEPSSMSHYAKEGESTWENLCLRGGPFHPIGPDIMKTVERLKSIYRYNPQALGSPEGATGE